MAKNMQAKSGEGKREREERRAKVVHQRNGEMAGVCSPTTPLVPLLCILDRQSKLDASLISDSLIRPSRCLLEDMLGRFRRDETRRGIYLYYEIAALTPVCMGDEEAGEEAKDVAYVCEERWRLLLLWLRDIKVVKSLGLVAEETMEGP